MNDEHELLYKLSKKAGKIVQLETTISTEETLTPELMKAEAFQIGLYGAGGQYLPHLDSLSEELSYSRVWGPNHFWIGNRIATVMFYLSDVVGGFTAFSNMGVAVKPIKGSAVLWYNLDKFGNPDWLTLHGGCPTALGIKWVSNKWIRQGAQIWKKPCPV